MPRTARYIEPNGFYHVISRSVNETWVLKDRNDFAHFLELMRRAKKDFPVLLFHYVLMNTHFHFVLQARDKQTLSNHLAYLKWYYTAWMRRKYGWKGPLWRERYKSLPIENEFYLVACGTYVEYNPVRAGICTNPADYPYSSYQKYHERISNNLVDEYELSGRFKEIENLDFQAASAKKIFSRSSAIGNPFYVQKYRSLKMGVPSCVSFYSHKI